MVSDIITKRPFIGYAESRIGGRSENQDTAGYADTELGLLVLVCDGMGGGPGGKTASLLAVQTIIQTIQECGNSVSREEALTKGAEAANKALVQKMTDDPSLKGMGTTLVALLINNESAVIAHIGDSRCYKIRGNECIFRTKDHSMVAEMVRSHQLTEEQARLSGQSNIITRALGANQTNCTPDFDTVAYEKGDRFVLCTDGIWGTMPHPKMVKLFGMRKSVPHVVEQIARDVDSLGIKDGKHHDNLTIAIVQTQRDSKIRDIMTRKAKMILVAMATLLFISCVFNLHQLFDKSIPEEAQWQIEEMQTRIKKQSAAIDSLNNLAKEQKLESQNQMIKQTQVIESQLNAKDKSFAAKEDSFKAKIKELNQQITSLKAKKTLNKNSVNNKNTRQR